MLKINPKLKSLFSKILNSYIEKKDFNSYIIENNIYSEEEIVIGYVKVNDKKTPLYRKFLSFNQTLTNGTTTNHGINNLDLMVNAHGWIKHPQWGSTPVPLTHNYIDGMIGFSNFNSTTFTWFIGKDIVANLANVPIIMTLEYTKTPD